MHRSMKDKLEKSLGEGRQFFDGLNNKLMQLGVRHRIVEIWIPSQPNLLKSLHLIHFDQFGLIFNINRLFG